MRRWKKEGIALLPGVSPGAVISAFSKAGYTATHDVIELYSEFGGMKEMDSDYLRLWSLDEIIAENAEHPDTGLLFADYLMSCWSFRLRVVSAGTSAVYVDHHAGSRQPELVANSLAEFLAAYARDPAVAHRW